MLQEGDILQGKYRILRKLGQGAEGSVHLALHTQTEQFWAVKEIRGVSSGRSLHELQMMKSLKNSHLPGIIDVLEQDGSTFLVMEYIRGMPLDKPLKRGGTISAQQAQDILLQTAEALIYLEGREPPVFHLDIKPANLIRRQDGRIMLVDFGSAGKGCAGRRTGTDGYAAPEQYEKEGKPDTRSDLYALGATVWKAMSGKTYSPKLHAGHVPNCPPDLSSVIRKCLEKDPKDRYQSAKELKTALVFMRKRRARKQIRLKLLGALALVFPAAAFSVSVLPDSLDLAKEAEWNYERLLEQAPVSGAGESRDLYRRAVLIDPARDAAYEQFLADAASDGVFSAEEERDMRSLLNTVSLGGDKTNEELLSEDPSGYGDFACRLALAYWNCGTGEDRKRIAGGWFRKAAEAEHILQEETEWGKLARLYLNLYESVTGLTEGAGDMPDPERALRYWESSEALLDTAGQIEDPLVRMGMYRDLLQAMPFLVGELDSAGISTQQAEQRVQRIVLDARALEAEAGETAVLKKLEAEAEQAGADAQDAIDNLARHKTMTEEDGGS